MKLNANTLKRDDFNSAEKDFKDVSAKVIASKDFSNANEKDSEIAKEFAAVDVAADTVTYLKTPREIQETADKAGARKFAPQTREQYANHIADLATAIKKNPTDTAALAEQSSKLQAEGQSLVQITQQSEKIKNAKPEEVSLEIEKLKALEAARATKLQQLAQSNAADATTGRQLQAEREAFERAKARFTSTEADVLEDGSNIILRLKSLKFTKNEAGLEAGQLAVLKKVQETIKDMKDVSTIRVEGHTDSTGKKALNQKLSEKRAQTVAGYFDSTLTANAKVETVGLGDQKPIAPNNTAEGRKMNRRVDIILAPGTPSSSTM